MIIAQLEAEFLRRSLQKRKPSGTTSFPMPSPGITAIL